MISVISPGVDTKVLNRRLLRDLTSALKALSRSIADAGITTHLQIILPGQSEPTTAAQIIQEAQALFQHHHLIQYLDAVKFGFDENSLLQPKNFYDPQYLTKLASALSEFERNTYQEVADVISPTESLRQIQTEPEVAPSPSSPQSQDLQLYLESAQKLLAARDKMSLELEGIITTNYRQLGLPDDYLKHLNPAIIRDAVWKELLRGTPEGQIGPQIIRSLQHTRHFPLHLALLEEVPAQAATNLNQVAAQEGVADLISLKDGTTEFLNQADRVSQTSFDRAVNSLETYLDQGAVSVNRVVALADQVVQASRQPEVNQAISTLYQAIKAPAQPTPTTPLNAQPAPPAPSNAQPAPPTSHISTSPPPSSFVPIAIPPTPQEIQESLRVLSRQSVSTQQQQLLATLKNATAAEQPLPPALVAQLDQSFEAPPQVAQTISEIIDRAQTNRVIDPSIVQALRHAAPPPTPTNSIPLILQELGLPPASTARLHALAISSSGTITPENARAVLAEIIRASYPDIPAAEISRIVNGPAGEWGAASLTALFAKITKNPQGLLESHHAAEIIGNEALMGRIQELLVSAGVPSQSLRDYRATLNKALELALLSPDAAQAAGFDLDAYHQMVDVLDQADIDPSGLVKDNLLELLQHQAPNLTDFHHTTLQIRQRLGQLQNPQGLPQHLKSFIYHQVRPRLPQLIQESLDRRLFKIIDDTTHSTADQLTDLAHRQLNRSFNQIREGGDFRRFLEFIRHPRAFFKQWFSGGFRSFFKDAGSFFSRTGQSFITRLGPSLKNFFGGIGNLIKPLGSAIKPLASAAGRGLLALGTKAAAAIPALIGGLSVSAIATIAAVIAVIVIVVLLGILAYQTFFVVDPLVASRPQPVAVGVGGQSYYPPADYCDPNDPACATTYVGPYGESPAPPTNSCSVVTQCPNGTYSHRGTNAIDFGLGSCSGSELEIRTPVAGQVVESYLSYPDGTGSGYGNFVKVAFQFPNMPGCTFWLIFAHLAPQHVYSDADPSDPDIDVNVGDIIGIGDNTGTSTGPHLHIELVAANGCEVPCITAVVPGTNCTCP